MMYFFSSKPEEVTAAIAADPYLIQCVTKQTLITHKAYEIAIRKDWTLGECGEPWMRQRYGRERIQNAQRKEGSEETARENVRADCEIVAKIIISGHGPPGTNGPTLDQKMWAESVLERQEEREQDGEVMSEKEFDELCLQKIS